MTKEFSKYIFNIPTHMKENLTRCSRLTHEPISIIVRRAVEDYLRRLYVTDSINK